VGEAPEQYRLTKKIGAGGFGSVYEAIKLADQNEHILKRICFRKVRREPDDNEKYTEVVMLQKTQELSNVVKLCSHFTTQHHLYLVFEKKANTTDLSEFVQMNSPISELNAKYILLQMLKVVIQLMLLRIIHGDLKPSNFIIDWTNFVIQLCDFGSAMPYEMRVYRSFRGTKQYAPPEYIMFHGYTADAINTWSLG
jgi:serine/threonine protein kinase